MSTCVKDSKCHGRGVFSTAFIPQGTPVWQFDETTCQIYTEAELTQWVAEHKDAAQQLLWGGYYHSPSDTFISIGDDERYKNHSVSPNCGGDFSDQPEQEVCVALRDIECGEELFDDYRTFATTASPWLTRIMAEHCPERLAFEQSLDP